MRRGFTLIELLTIVAIIAIIVGVAVASIGSGQRVARLRGATRDVFATIRQARSVALVTQQPSVITYSSVKKDGEICARVVLDSVRLMSGNSAGVVETLSGERIDLSDPNGESEQRRARGKKQAQEEEETTDPGGETIEEILFAPIEEEVFRGIAIKVVVGDENLAETDEIRHAALSAFSNADSLVGKYQKAKKEEKKADEESDQDQKEETTETQEPVRVAWEPNGRCEPHQIWIYLEGSDPETGLSIRVDRFGAAKVLSSDDD